MAEYVDVGDDQMKLLGYPPPQNSADKIDVLWRQIMAYKAFSDSELSESRARRADADAAREQAEQQAAEATRQLCEGIKAEADKKPSEAEELKSQAERVLQQADSERTRARYTINKAEEARDRIVAEARQREQQTLDEARKAAQQECTELRREAIKEIKAILARVESVRAAADEQLETQRIFYNIAKLKAISPALTVQPGYRSDNGSEDYQVQEPGKASRDGADVESHVDEAEQPHHALAPASSDGKFSAVPTAKSDGTTPKSPKGKDKKANKHQRPKISMPANEPVVSHQRWIGRERRRDKRITT